MAQKMKAAVLYGPHDLRIEERDRPQITYPDQVLVRIRAVGICGSDIHYYLEGRIGQFVVEKPIILGHECAGEVAEIGQAVTNLRIGDRVALEPGIPCRKCRWCKSGRYNICPSVTFMATPPDDGAFCEMVVHPADFVYRLPDQVSLEEGAMLEPMAVGIQAAKQGEVQPGDRVLVVGAGPIGLVSLQAAREQGATQIIVADLQESRLSLARKLGATDTVNVKDQDLSETVGELTEGDGVDVILECAGSAQAVEQSCRIMRRGGILVLVGFGAPEIAVPLADFIAGEFQMRTAHRYANCYPPALALVAAGRVDVKSLITHEYSLDDTEAALQFAHQRKDVAIKVLVRP